MNHGTVPPPIPKSEAAPNTLGFLLNSGWILAGNVFSSASQWLILVVLARLGNAEQLGQFALAFAIATPISLFFNMGLAAAVTTETRDEFHFRDYLWTRIFSCGLTLPLLAGIGFATTLGPDSIALLLSAGLWRAMDSVAELYWARFIRFERMHLTTAAKLSRSLTSLAAFTISFHATSSVALAIFAGAVARFASLLLVDVRKSNALPQSRDTRTDFSRVLSVVRATYPLGFTQMLNALAFEPPLYILAATAGEGPAGRYAAIAYLGLVTTQFTFPLGQASQPLLARLLANRRMKEANTEILRTLTMVAVIGLAGILLAHFAGQSILAAVYGDSYDDLTGVLVIIMAAAMMMGLVGNLGRVITAAREYKIQVPIAATTLISCFTVGMLVIPTHGLYGTAWVVLLINFLALGLRAVALTRILRNDPRP